MTKAENGGGVGDPEAETETGLARARRVLVVPLAALDRPRRVAAGVHADALESLARKVSYMTDANLAGLAELVLSHAGRVAKTTVPVCPEPGLILSWAYALQSPPPRQSDYARSVMHSAMGAAARDGGWMVELFRTAKRMGPPPGAYLSRDMQVRADEDRRRRLRIREAIEAGRATSDDQRWLAQYHVDAAEAEALVLHGMDHRAQDHDHDQGSSGQGVAA